MKKERDQITTVISESSADDEKIEATRTCHIISFPHWVWPVVLIALCIIAGVID